LALVITRRTAETERPATTVLWSACAGALVLSLLLPFDAHWPTLGQMGLALMLGVLASVGQMVVVLAYRHAPASVLAPFSYAQLVWAGIAGWLVFGNLPDHWTLVGAAIIAASGVYTAHRERVRSRFSA
jgi:drug/metabolite transporter (DMT)-like permease